MPLFFSRRDTLRLGAITALGSLAAMTGPAHAADITGDRYVLEGAEVVIHPVNHASLVMALPGYVIYADPVGGAALYDGLPVPDLILITHDHGDHYDAETLANLVSETTRLITSPAVFDMLPAALKAKAQPLANGESATIGALAIHAVPAYNMTEDRLNYHPKGRGNGYVLVLAGGGRIYIAGDTEDIPEMQALAETGIDIAFLPMNLPFTMEIEQAANAVALFKPEYVYPYHYRGTDIEAFARLVEQSGIGTKVVLRDWYG
jgi:L-ascorbate metabolism protein UlaG (beta-lactamase superfamily)